MIQKIKEDLPIKNNGGVSPMPKDIHIEKGDPTLIQKDIVTIKTGGTIYATSVVTNKVYKKVQA